MADRINQPLWLCVVRRTDWRIRRIGVFSEAVRNTDAGVHGCLLACSVGGLRDWTHWVFAFGRRRLRRANDAAMGHELPKRRCADNGARTPHADLRICDLAADCCSFVADGEKDAER